MNKPKIVTGAMCAECPHFISKHIKGVTEYGYCQHKNEPITSAKDKHLCCSYSKEVK